MRKLNQAVAVASAAAFIAVLAVPTGAMAETKAAKPAETKATETKSSGFKVDAKFARTLKLLMPDDRMAQLCDYTALAQIRKEHSQHRPDRAVANATTDIVIAGNTLDVNGGAFRSRGKWYGINYTCKTDAEHLNVLSFDYKIGDEIPQEKWAGYGLWQ